MNLKVVVVDDEPIARQGIKSFIEKIDFITFSGEAKNVEELKDVLDHTDVDLIFLDIEMSGLSEIDFVKTYGNTLPLIIFITAYHEYAVESYELHAVDYLLKPVSFDRFVDASNRALDIKTLSDRRNNTNASFYIKQDGRYVKVDPKEVLYISSMQNYVNLHSSDQKKLTIRSTLKEFLSHFDPDDFIMIHKSYIVNKECIESMTATHLTLRGSVQLPIGRKFKPTVKNALLR